MSNKLLSHQEQACLVFAARYAHTRETAAAYYVVNAIIKNWDNLSLKTKKQLKQEAKNESTCNYSDWNRLIKMDN